MQGGTCQEVSTAPALPSSPKTRMQQHFLIIFFTADLWWRLQGKERKLLECWEWECQKYSPYAHWGQNLQKKFALFVPISAVRRLGVTKGCLLTRQTWLWWKSHPCCLSRPPFSFDHLGTGLPSTLHCSLQDKTLPKGSSPGQDGHTYPMALSQDPNTISSQQQWNAKN